MYIWAWHVNELKESKHCKSRSEVVPRWSGKLRIEAYRENQKENGW